MWKKNPALETFQLKITVKVTFIRDDGIKLLGGG